MPKYEKILLIDDDEITNYINENLIESVGIGKQIATYKAAEKALNDIRDEDEHPPTLILLDLKMPVFDGFDFLEDYNSLPASIKKNLRLMVLTTSENPKDLKKLKELGDYEVIVKPLTQENLSNI
jgi:CheY-like chemotaxis protein